ncbi:MAG: PAS domain S-box protein, partial [Saprospiraceae bacterium]|nr:PAS domain S-box protein [Saprospiraceae bacterium]
MHKLSSRQASMYAIIVFLLTIGLSYFLPGYPIMISGLLVVIFLSTFINDTRSTIFAGIGSVMVIIGFILYNLRKPNIYHPISEHLFVLLLVLFTTSIVLYVKRLYRNISFDKTHLTSLFENATEGIILTNKDGLIILVNPAAEKMFEYQAKELTGQNIDLLVPQKYRHRHVKLREGFLAVPGDRVMGHGRDLHGTKKNGQEFPVEVSLSFYKQKEEPHVIAFIVDITHRKSIESNMHLQQEELAKVTNDIRKLNIEKI